MHRVERLQRDAARRAGSAEGLCRSGEGVRLAGGLQRLDDLLALGDDRRERLARVHLRAKHDRAIEEGEAVRVVGEAFGADEKGIFTLTVSPLFQVRLSGTHEPGCPARLQPAAVDGRPRIRSSPTTASAASTPSSTGLLAGERELRRVRRRERRFLPHLDPALLPVEFGGDEEVHVERRVASVEVDRVAVFRMVLDARAGAAPERVVVGRSRSCGSRSAAGRSSTVMPSSGFCEARMWL